jgi:uncharacterized protein (DUF362 family)
LIRVPSSAIDLKESINHALNLADFKSNRPITSVVVKPNLCYYWDSSTGCTTDPRVVSGIVDVVRERFGKNIDIKVVEADASAMHTKHVFPVLRYDKLAKEKDIELFNLSNGTLSDETVHINGRKISFKIPELLRKCDLFINVPKLKIMRVTKITCAMKNVFGCIGYPKKLVYHKFLDEAIVGINKILHPHLTIVDGLVALGRFPVKLGLIMAGVDSFSIDWTASRIMGYRPSSVRFLKMAMTEKLGDPSDIVIRGEKVEQFAQSFPKEGFVSSKYLWNIEFSLLKAYQRLSGDVIPPVLEES